MVLRLSSSSSTLGYLNSLVEDGQLPLGRKTDCLKTMKIIIGNLADPVKSQDEKYRRLNLNNAKLQAKVFSITYMMDLLETLGFEKQQEGEESFLILTGEIGTAFQTCLEEILAAQDRLSGSAVTATVANAKVNVFPGEKLSEKQKARRLLEEKERLEKQQAKENRKRNLALLREDKIARQTDPNWKAKVSAACAKTGTGISTFRDKYGE